jgi:hypothetical protein
MKYKNYQILWADDSSLLVTQVNQALNEDYVLIGAPYHSGRHSYQAVAQLEEKQCEICGCKERNELQEYLANDISTFQNK